MSASVEIEAPSADTKDSSEHVRSPDDVDNKYEDYSIVEFIGRKFKKRECTKFVPTDQSGNLCFCGYQLEDHSSKDSDGSRKENLDIKNNTSASPTDAFGDLEFPSYGGKIRKYIRVDHETEVEDLLDLMLNHWGMKRPNLLISVTGEDKAFKKKLRQHKVFRHMLIKAVESTSAWIVTGGMNVGVMKLVGKATLEYATKHASKSQLVALGIATWGCTENRKNLISRHVPPRNADQTFAGRWPAKYKSSETQQKNDESSLDPNHTHFILVDNGTQNVSGVEIDLRAKLESAVVKCTNRYSTSIPAVCLVFGGGPNTLETVKKSIEAETPVIILKGSEGATDILAYAYSKINELKASDNNIRWKEVKEKIKSEFEMTVKALIEKSIACVRACIRKIDFMTVIPLDGKSSADDISITISLAVLNVNQTNKFVQLGLALAWNKLDFAKEEIFTDKFPFEGSDLHNLMFVAIVNNRVEFVKLFLEKGVSLKEFLAADGIMLGLYNDPLTKGKCVQLEKKAKDAKRVISYEEIWSLAEDLSRGLFGAHHQKPACKEKSTAKDVFEPVQNARNPATKDKTKHLKLPEITNSTKEGCLPVALLDAPTRLFLWSIFHQMKDMAMVFWSEGKEKTALAVVGHLFSKGLLKQEQDTHRAKDLQEQVIFFEELADGLLTEYHSSDPQKTMQLLKRPLPGFAKTTALEIAVQADNKKFVAHSACQNLLNGVWMGELTNDNAYFKLLISILCPMVAPFLLKFRKDDEEQSEKNDIVDFLMTSEFFTRNNSTISNSDGKSPPCFVAYLQNLVYFFRAPIIKFWYDCIAYIAFLVLFALILLTDFYPTISIKEQVLIAWVVTIILEEIRQMATNDAMKVRWKLYKYITDIWNILDVIAIVTFIVGMILRFIPVSLCADCFYASRIILAINFMTFCLRILHMFSIHRELGPKLAMIGQMVIDLFYFIIILMVFIAAYGIASHVILYPNQHLNIALALDVLSRSWWNIFGELGLDEVSGKLCQLNKTMNTAYVCASMDYDEHSQASCPGKDDQCPAINWLVPVLLACYALMTIVLMLNLLIAMFSNTFLKIQGQTNLVWKMQRYHLVREYYLRPFLPPPLIFLAHIFRFLRFILRRMNCCPSTKHITLKTTKQSTTFGFRAKNPKPNVDEMFWEKVTAKEFQQKKEADECESMSNQIKKTNERVEFLIEKVLQSTSPNVQQQQPQVLEGRLLSLEKQMEQLLQMQQKSNLILQNMGLHLPDTDKQKQEDFRRKQLETCSL